MKEVTKNTIRMPIIWGASLLVLGLIQWYFDLFLGNEIIDHPSLYCAIIWILFASFCGNFEAWHYHYSSWVKGKVPNQHTMLTMIRTMTMIPIFILTDWKSVLCYVAMFPFFYDGNYYAQRHRITPSLYPKGWFAQSTTSTAWTTKYMPPVVRTILAIVSLTLLIIFTYV